MKKILSFIFNKKFWLNKWTIIVTSIIIVVSGMAFTYLYNPSFVPQIIKSANKKVVDKIVGKELAEKIDETRDENGATSIRTLFNINKEENLARHCEKKEEKGKEQEKCYKTYKNEEYGYSVSYPEKWKIKNGTEEIKNSNKDVLNYMILDPEFTDINKARVIIETKISYGIEEDIERELSGVFYSDKKEITINGKTGTIIKGMGVNYETEQPETNFTTIFLKSDEKVFVINYVKDINDKDDLQKYFEAIYSSFIIK